MIASLLLAMAFGILIGIMASILVSQVNSPRTVDRYWEGHKRGARWVHDEIAERLRELYDVEELDKDKPPHQRKDQGA